MSSPSSASATLTFRTQKEIDQLVLRRVKERNAWTVDGAKTSPITLRQAFSFMTKSMPEMLFFKVDETELDKVFPVLAMDWDRIKAASDTKETANNIQLTWLGHSSLLIQMNGCNIVTDSVFSYRCSPSQWFGPKRYRKAPCTIQELCAHVDIDLVLISHNHYDHLDYPSVLDFYKHSNAQFVVPLGLADWFRRNVDKNVALHELDWHESFDYDTTLNNAIKITSLPMRHWSNRSGDRDKTLWCGYSIQAKCGDSTNRVLFPGDTAWFDQLEQVGKNYGPFDVAALPIGAYEPREFMKHNHTDVLEAVRMKDATKAKHAVPIHWGTFPLTTEPRWSRERSCWRSCRLDRMRRRLWHGRLEKRKHFEIEV
ncbi:hypothetical protein MPSEU_000447200 [Mayamaea pseudoterrestris]|nr:hypothetical protein MPSEU_000447200 [Mayamaea pseudoterrestris]